MPIPASQPPTTFAAVESGGHLFLSSGRDLWALEPQSLSIESSWVLDGSAAAVITTSFDRNVYVAVNDTIDVFDSNHLAEGPLTTTRVPGAPGLIAADPVPPLDSRGPTECAC